VKRLSRAVHIAQQGLEYHAARTVEPAEHGLHSHPPPSPEPCGAITTSQNEAADDR
jgi:hypothetical protein